MRGPLYKVALYLVLTSVLSACATITRNETAPAPICAPARSAGMSAAPRWLLAQSAAALHATGSFFIGFGNVGLQITQGAGGQVPSGNHEFAVYLGITIVSAGSVGVGNLFISGGDRLAALSAPAAPQDDDCVPRSAPVP